MTNATENTTKTKATLVVWHALTPVHSGTGQGGTGIIDLPIAREAATNFPMLPASSIKGVLRNGDGLKKEDENRVATEKDKLFGYVKRDSGKKDENGEKIYEGSMGQLTFTDARLLALPVRSYKGTFAYVTCPLVIRRLARDVQALGLGLELPKLPEQLDPEKTHLASEMLVHEGKVLFEDIDLTAVQCPTAQKLAQTLAQWTGIAEVGSRLAVVSDDVFAYFSETATEVSAHIRLKAETKTVAGGALWYEETLPAESLLSCFVIGGAWPAEKEVLQVGGKGTVGRGLLHVREVQE